jgi:hypothetical protein
MFSRINGLDTTKRAVNLQEVADSDRPFPHEDPAGNEVVDYILGAKSNADGDCAGEERERAERYVQHAQGREEQDREYGEPQYPIDQLDQVGVLASFQQILREFSNEPRGKGKSHDNRHAHHYHLAQGNRAIPQTEYLPIHQV